MGMEKWAEKIRKVTEEKNRLETEAIAADPSIADLVLILKEFDCGDEGNLARVLLAIKNSRITVDPLFVKRSWLNPLMKERAIYFSPQGFEICRWDLNDYRHFPVNCAALVNFIIKNYSATVEKVPEGTQEYFKGICNKIVDTIRSNLETLAE